MSDSRTYAEQACYFSQLSNAAPSAEERESYLSIAAGYLGLAKHAARPVAGQGLEPLRPARFDRRS
jgi:hypothetical protein